ncbi:MAG: hypothetical protein JOZ96_28235 [Acidobacteria bacterium]|nr:hypothetical protein [Acidobacteriota bacterium]
MQYLIYLLCLGAFVVQILVAVKMFQNAGAIHGILGIICGLYAYIWGWMNSGKLNIKNLMIIWTALIILIIVLNFVFGASMAAGSYGPVPTAP